MDTPESVLVDQKTGTAYVSNIEPGGGGYWAGDGKAFISRLKPGGEPDLLRWKTSTPEMLLHAPKGMCLAGESLYVADNRKVVGFPLSGPDVGGTVQGLTGERLNDMATDGKAVYVSDTGAAKIYRIDDKGHTAMPAPEGINGITFFGGKMFGVSWGGHEVYELDPAGSAEAVPFGLASHFKTLDGIEVLDDGTFVVSDLEADGVYTISPDRKTVRKLVSVKSPADIGVDRKRGLLYVPSFNEGRVTVYKLEKSPAAP